MKDASVPSDPAVGVSKTTANSWPIFISYRRNAFTRKLAIWLKEELEGQPIAATTGQTFNLDVFVDAAESHHSDFQANLVPHLQHSRALIVLADQGVTTRKATPAVDYLYDELDWWATERRKTPPIILQVDSESASRLVAQSQFAHWRKVNFMDCFWETWSSEADAGKHEREQLLRQIRQSIRDYGQVIHLDEVRRLKRRAMVAAIFALVAAIAFVIAGLYWVRASGAAINERNAREKADDLVKEASRSDHFTAEALLREGRWREGVTHLERSIRFDSTNDAAALHLWSALVHGGGIRTATPRLLLPADSGSNPSFARNGEWFATQHDREVAIWRSDTGAPLKRLRHKSRVRNFVLSPDCMRILTMDEELCLRLWSVDTGLVLHELFKHEDPPNSTVFSPDGTVLVTVCVDSGKKEKGISIIRVWDVITGKLTTDALGVDSSIGEIVFSHNGSRFVAIEQKGEVVSAQIRHTSTAQPDGAPITHGRMITCAEFSTDDALLLTGSAETVAMNGGGSAWLWDVSTRRPVFKTDTDPLAVHLARLSPDATRIVTSNAMLDGSGYAARLYDLKGSDLKGIPINHPGSGFRNVRHLAFSPDGRSFITSSINGTTAIWDSSTGLLRFTPITNSKSGLFEAAFSFNEHKPWMLSTTENRIVMWNLCSAPCFGLRLSHDWTPEGSASFSGNGTRFAHVSRPGSIAVMSLPSCTQIGSELSHSNSVHMLRLSPNGQCLASVTGTSSIQFWNVDSSRLLATQTVHKDSIVSLRFTEDSRQAVSASRDHTVAVWNAASGSVIGSPIVFDGPVHDAILVDNGRSLLSIVERSAAKRASLMLTPLSEHGNPGQSPSPIFECDYNPDSGRIGLAVSTDETVVTVLTNEEEVHVLRRNGVKWSSTPVASKKINGPGFFATCLTRDGKSIVASTVSGSSVASWDTASSSQSSVELPHTGIGRIGGVSVSANGRWVAIGSDSGTTRVWDRWSGRPVSEPLAAGNKQDIRNSLTSSDGQWVFSDATPSPGSLWHLPVFSKDETARLGNIAIAATGLRFTPGGNAAELPISDWVSLIRTLQTEEKGQLRDCVNTLFGDISQQRALPGVGPPWGDVVNSAVNSGELEAVKSALAKEPENPLLLLALARFETNEERASFLRRYAVSRLPKDATLLATAAKLLIAQRAGEEANMVSSEAERLDPTLPEALRYGFYANVLNGKDKDAIEKIVRLTATPNAKPQDWADAVYSIACDGVPERTLEFIQSAAKAYPESPEVLVASGRAFHLLQMHSEALRCFEQAKLLFGAMDGHRPDVTGGIFISKWSLGIRDEVTKECEEFLSQKFISADHTLAEDQLAMGRLATREWPLTFSWNPKEKAVLDEIRAGIAGKHRISALQKSFDRFPILRSEVDAKGKVIIIEKIFNEDPILIDGIRYDGFRFTATRKVLQEFLWFFQSPDNVESWYILPKVGTMKGFNNFFPLTESRRDIVQALDGNSLVTGDTYLIWFSFKDDKPSSIRLGFVFAEIGQDADGSFNQQEIIKALGLAGLKSAKRQTR